MRASWLPRLAALDSCACSDAMDQLGIAGVAHGLRAPTIPRQAAGPVITVELGLVGSAPASRRHLGTAAIEAARPGDVIVVAAGGRVDAAGWGGILSLAAAIRRVSGVIIDGACRDVDESAALMMPVYALAAVPATARGRHAEVAWNGPVQVAGVQVCPGDLVVADASGVVFLPAGQAEDIIAVAEDCVAVETAMARRIRAGEPASRVLSTSYEEMLNRRQDSR